MNRVASIRASLLAQRRLFPWILVGLYAPALGLLVLTVVISAGIDVPVSMLTRDPAAVMEANPLYGMLSNIGILLWCSAGAISLFSAAVVWNNETEDNSRLFLLFSGLFTLFLVLDDLFMLHDDLLERYLHIGQTSFFLGYFVIMLLYLIGFRKAILNSQFVLLVLALGFFGLSIAIDIVPEMMRSNQELWTDVKQTVSSQNTVPWYYLIEDALKLFGIVSWFGFLVGACLQRIGALLPRQAQQVG
jgi:hypothetical protein